MTREEVAGKQPAAGPKSEGSSLALCQLRSASWFVIVLAFGTRIHVNEPGRLGRFDNEKVQYTDAWGRDRDPGV